MIKRMAGAGLLATALTGAYASALGAGNQLATGDDFSGAARDDGSLWMWGNGRYGQLGDGRDGFRVSRSQPAFLPDLVGVQALGAGTQHAVALLADGSVWVWGRNNDNQLGDGSTQDQSRPERIEALDGVRVNSIHIGPTHNLVIDEHGTLRSAGDSANSALGGGGGWRPIPTLEGRNVIDAAAGYTHSLAVDDDGQVWAWGRNDRGQVTPDLDDQDTVTEPTQVTALNHAEIISVAAGSDLSVAVSDAGVVYTWGRSSNERLGRDSSGSFQADSISDLEDVPGGASPFLRAASGEAFTLVLDDQDTLWSWGSNNSHQLGTGDGGSRGDSRANLDEPFFSPSDTGIRTFAAGPERGMAASLAGDLFAWGDGDSGALGPADDDEADRSTPQRVAGGEGADAFSLAFAGEGEMPLYLSAQPAHGEQPWQVQEDTAGSGGYSLTVEQLEPNESAAVGFRGQFRPGVTLEFQYRIDEPEGELAVKIDGVKEEAWHNQTSGWQSAEVTLPDAGDQEQTVTLVWTQTQDAVGEPPVRVDDLSLPPGRLIGNAILSAPQVVELGGTRITAEVEATPLTGEPEWTLQYRSSGSSSWSDAGDPEVLDERTNKAFQLDELSCERHYELRAVTFEGDSVATEGPAIEARTEECSIGLEVRERSGGIDDDECFIATAAFGTAMEPRIDLLRAFRDDILMQTAPGRWFVDAYYTHGAAPADYIAERPLLSGVVRVALVPLMFLAWLTTNPAWPALGLAVVLAVAGAHRITARENLV